MQLVCSNQQMLLHLPLIVPLDIVATVAVERDTIQAVFVKEHPLPSFQCPFSELQLFLRPLNRMMNHRRRRRRHLVGLSSKRAVLHSLRR